YFPSRSLVFLFSASYHPLPLHSFPTRRSSDLSWMPGVANFITHATGLSSIAKAIGGIAPQRDMPEFTKQTFKKWFSQNHNGSARSEEHTSELQSRFDLVCRLLLEKKKNTKDNR